MTIDFELLKAFYKEAYNMGFNSKLVGGSLGKIDQPENFDVAKAFALATHNLQKEINRKETK